MRLFFDPHIDPNASQHQLSEDESKHIIRVLRLAEGDTLGILNGKGQLFSCRIDDAHPKRCTVAIESIEQEADMQQEIHIAVAPTKQMERIEWFIEKAVEIGVTHITLLDCKNGERAKINIDRLEKKAIAAMKQSQRWYLPELHALTSFENFIEAHPFGLVAHCYESEKHAFSDVFTPVNCPILIGPEGDFTEAEVAMALEKGYKTITLGKNRLRTETAALYACMRAKIAMEE